MPADDTDGEHLLGDCIIEGDGGIYLFREVLITGIEN